MNAPKASEGNMLCTIVAGSELRSSTSNAAIDASDNESAQTSLTQMSKNSSKSKKRKGGDGTSLLRNVIPIDRETFHYDAKKSVLSCSFQKFWYDNSSASRDQRKQASEGFRAPGFRDFGSVLLATIVEFAGEEQYVWGFAA